jgi:hypothetical protein
VIQRILFGTSKVLWDGLMLRLRILPTSELEVTHLCQPNQRQALPGILPAKVRQSSRREIGLRARIADSRIGA